MSSSVEATENPPVERQQVVTRKARVRALGGTSTVLVGDIGATHARLAIIEPEGEDLRVRAEETLLSQGYPSLEKALSAFLDQHPEARGAATACFGLAGPIRGNRCETTNLPWTVERDRLAAALALPPSRIHLLNDLEAAAWGLGALAPGGTRTLRQGDSFAVGNRALLAPGTGLGEAALLWNGHGYLPLATEGGHADFSPNDDEQVELWRFLAARHGHVSWERVLSGPGLVNLYQFQLHRWGDPEPEWLRRELAEGDAAAAISSRALDHSCSRCVDSLGLFLALLGAEAGNLALRTLATGGVYLAGGIVPRLFEHIPGGRFLSAFQAKGRFRAYLETLPIHVVVDNRIALWGCAAKMLGELELYPPEAQAQVSAASAGK